MTDVKHFIFVSLSHCLIVSAHVSRLASHVKPRQGDAMAPHATTKVSASHRLCSRLASHVSRQTAPWQRHGATRNNKSLSVSPSRRLCSRLMSRVSRQTAPWQRHGATRNNKSLSVSPSSPSQLASRVSRLTSNSAMATPWRHTQQQKSQRLAVSPSQLTSRVSCLTSNRAMATPWRNTQQQKSRRLCSPWRHCSLTIISPIPKIPRDRNWWNRRLSDAT